MLLKDKHFMRKRLDEVGISPVMHRVVRSAGELTAFWQDIGGPAFVKPVNGAASIAASRVENAQDAEAAWERITESGYLEGLAEEFLTGPEFSVEAYSWHAEHVVLAMTRKLLAANHLEIGHSMPARMDETAKARAQALVKQMLDAVGLVEGPSHTEIRLTPNGPRIIESHNRAGGSRLFEMMAHAVGVDIIKMAVAVPLGLSPLEGIPPGTRRRRSAVFPPRRAR